MTRSPQHGDGYLPLTRDHEAQPLEKRASDTLAKLQSHLGGTAAQPPEDAAAAAALARLNGAVDAAKASLGSMSKAQRRQAERANRALHKALGDAAEAAARAAELADRLKLDDEIEKLRGTTRRRRKHRGGMTYAQLVDAEKAARDAKATGQPPPPPDLGDVK